MEQKQECPHKQYLDKGMEGLEHRMGKLEEKFDSLATKLFDKMDNLSESITELKTERRVIDKNIPIYIAVITIGLNAMFFFVGKIFK